MPDYLNLVAMTQSERTEARPYLPVYLIPLFNDGGGNHYCLDTRYISDGDCPVVFWNHELDEDQTPEVDSESFVTWLVALVETLKAEPE